MIESPGRRLRALLENDAILVLPGAYDAITGRLIQSNGFAAAYMSGGATANAQFGLPDNGLVTLTEMVETARKIASSVDLPLLCDADTGYGNAVNAARTVREFEAAGAAGIHIEDQFAPKRCGHLEGKHVVPVEEMVGKIKAAIEARRDDDFVVVARTDAAAVEGVADAIERARAYAAAGADAVFTEALTSTSEFRRFAAADVGVPLVANMTEFGKTPYLSAQQFQDIGYAAVIFPMITFRTMLRAVSDVLTELQRSGTQIEVLDQMMTRAQQYELIEYDHYHALERRFMT